MSPLAGRRSALRSVVASGGKSRAAAAAAAAVATARAIAVAGSCPAPAPASRSSVLVLGHQGHTRTHHHHHHSQHNIPVRHETPPQPPRQQHHQQIRGLQTSSPSSSPCPLSSSSSPSPSPSPSSYSPPVDPGSLRRAFPRLLLGGRQRRLRYTYLPAIIMGASHQTRDNGGDHHPSRSPSSKANKDASHDHDHEDDHGHGHGHSHSHGFGHHHHHDNSYLISKDRSDPGVRITNIGLLSNLLMAVAKFIGGWHFNSKSMVADGWHSLTDLASDILTLATVSWSIKPPSEQFPLGFGKVESLGALGVSGLLLVGGCYMGWESAISLYAHFDPAAAHELMEHMGHGHGHSHSHSAAALGIPSIHAAWLAAGTVVVKEWLYHATMKVAREKHSSVLASNAVHHRVDSLTGIVTLAAIVGANVIETAGWLDPVGGLLISFMVVHAGAGNMFDALRELADKGVEPEITGNVRRQAQRAIAGLEDSRDVELRDVSGIKSGPNYLMDLEMAVPGTWSVEHVRKMEETIRQSVGAKVKGIKRVRVRFVSVQEPINGKFDEFINDAVHQEAEGHSDKTGKPKGH